MIVRTGLRRTTERSPSRGCGSRATTPGDTKRARSAGGTDRPSFVLPDGSRLPTRLTAVLHSEQNEWKIVHLHFSVGGARRGCDPAGAGKLSLM